MRVRGLSGYVQAATIGALAFAKGSRLKAVMLWLGMFLSTVMIATHGKVYVSEDGNGTVAIRRLGLWAYLIMLSVVPMVLVVVFGVTFFIALVWPIGAIYVPLVASAMLLLLTAWVLAGLIITLQGRPTGASIREVGRETPKGCRYGIGNLAQRPGTRWSALFLVRDAIAEMPAGSVLCAVAGSAELQDVYVRRGGLSAGKRLRVYRVI
ncbi:hypothetical protein [Microbacterium sp. GXS0129]|uniref:hypothetical protein n=1 Tax=Microbacterium sp. GXS0129 TaxID=3377836 RepID=UPI00383A9E9F